MGFNSAFKGLNPICYLLPLLVVHHIFHISGLRVKNEGSYNSTPPVCLHDVDRDPVNFYLLWYGFMELTFEQNF